MRISTTIMAASLTALILSFAIGASAEDSGIIYKSLFTSSDLFSGDVKLRLQDDSMAPMLVLAEDSSRRLFPVRFELGNNEIDLQSRRLPVGASSLMLFYSSRSRRGSHIQPEVFHNRGRRPRGRWDEPSILTTAILLDVVDSLSNYRVGAVDTHTVAFTTTTAPLSDSGIVWITFPPGFDISGVTEAVYSDNDPSNDGSEPTIRLIAAEGQSLQLYFDYIGQQAAIGSRIWLEFSPVINDTTAGENSVLVMSTRENGELINGPIDSQIFTLLAESLDHISVWPDTASSLMAGFFLDLSAAGYDRYDNVISGIAFSYDVTVDSCGQILDSGMKGSKLGSCYVIASVDGLLDSTGLITVYPGALSRFSLSNYPSSRIAGQPFSDSVLVVALDSESNIKYDYLGQLWFSTNDTIDILPHISINPYTFGASDSGKVKFPGSSFILRRAGTNRTINATNGSIVNSSSPIRVTAAAINSFSMSAASPQTVGVAFYVDVASALDLYGNPASGEITVSDSIGGGNSPDGIPPSYSQIVVNSGTGRSLQTLTNAVSTTLKGVAVSGGARAGTAQIQVLPGTLGRFNLARYPDIITAGDIFPQSITVSAMDIFGNLKTNYNGSVFFTSTDPRAVLPYIPGSPYTFTISDQGVHNFNESFSLLTAGRQNISVTNGMIETISNAITVAPDQMTSFNFAAPGSVIAGQSFTATVVNARDQWGNSADGIILVSDSVGGGSSPNGMTPTFNQIVVSSGSGQAMQILVRTVPTILKGILSGGNLHMATSLIQVQPGSLARFDVTGYPSEIAAGEDFPDDISVSVYDGLGNLKTDFDDNVYFTSTDPIASLPYIQSSQYHFMAAHHGTHIFTEPFTLFTSGYQRITITNDSISTSSDLITVLSDNIDAFTLTAPDTVIAGQPFVLVAADVHDQWGNPANGIISVSDSIGGGPSPGGDQPTLNHIVVADGSGQTQQLLVNAVPTRLKGLFADGVFVVTDSIIVRPAAIARFGMTGVPTSSVAGDTFSTNVDITAYDSFENIKTDLDDFVYFQSTDPRAILPFTQSSPYHFTATDNGFHSFVGPFSLLTSGWRRISITDGSIEKISEAIDVAPDVISEFSLSAPDSVAAGQSFFVSVGNALDQFGNAAGGIIIVSDSTGGGAAPDGTPPSYSQITVNAGNGQALQILTNAIPTRLKGVLSGGNVRVATNNIVVQPGALDRFDVTGYPGNVVAGEIFAQDISVSVFDLFDNLKTNFDGFVYFTSNDPQALLPYTQSTPFHFLAEFAGMHTFDEQFSLRTSGARTVAFTNGARQTTSPSINVSPAIISAFTLNAPGGAIAGQPFSATVTEARDIWSNLANGTVVISDSIGGGQSPNGTDPVFTSVSVSSGAGSASQTLFNVLPTVLKGVAGSVVRTTGQIDISPAQLGRFDFALSSPQYEGNPFSGTASLTAFDRYGNLKTDNNASTDTVLISSSAGGVMENNILRSPADFTNGVADLAALGTTFYGRGGQMSFLAASQSGINASSGNIDMNAMTIQSLNIIEESVRHGDTVSGSVSVSNIGGVQLEVTAIDIVDSVGTVFNYALNPALPHLVDPGQTTVFSFEFGLPTNVPFGTHPITADARGIYSTVTLDTAMVVDTIPGYPDRFTVTAGSVPVYISGTIYPETLSTGSTYAFSLRLGNTGVSGLALYDTSYFTFTDGVRQIRADLSSPIYLPPDSPSGVAVTLDPVEIDQAFTPGSYQGVFRFYGTESSLFRSGEISITDPVIIETRAALAYLAGSLNIDSLVSGQNAAFAIRVNNSGNADFIVNHQNTQLSFSDGPNEYLALSDTSSANRIDIIRSGDTTFHFARVMVPSNFASGNYQPNVIISGYQNGHPEVVSFATGDTVKVLTPAAVRLDSTISISFNAPLVNTMQACSIRVVIENIGDEAAESLSVHLGNTGGSVFPDSILVSRISGHEMMPLVFVGNAGPDSDQGEVLTSSIVGGKGAISRTPLTSLQPLDNTAILVIETPAYLSISPISVVDPPEAMDDTISTGQSVTISATVWNLGEAGISNSRRLILNPGLTGWEVDSLTRDFQLGQAVTWRLTAPGTASDSAGLLLGFANRIFDLNDNSSAFGPDSLSSHFFIIDTRPFITHSAAITAPDGAIDGEVSTNQIFVVSDTLTAHGDYAIKGVRLQLPDGFTTNDSLVKFPEGDIAAWTLRAPATAGSASIMLSSWIYDINTGDSIGALPDHIDMSVVSSASLGLSSRISGPPTALDGIVQPGGQLIFEAVVRNNGAADVGGGQMRLILGRSDMTPLENLIRDFIIDEPIVWTIDMPDIEVNSPIPVSAVISDIPIEENTGQASSVAVDSSAVTIIIRELYPNLTLTDITGYSGSVYKGQQLQFLTFELLNSDFGGNFPIAVTGFTFDIASNPPADASALISGASVSSDSGASQFGGFAQNRFSVNLSDTVYIEPDGRVQFSLNLSILPNTGIRDFTISVAEDFVDADVIENGIAAQELLPVSPRGEPVSWQSDPTAIVEQSFAASISSYPNPFSPREGGTRIGYYLPTLSGLEVKIFTLLGELVWTKNIPATDPLASAGLHTGSSALVWEGKNDIGNEIRSGVYICMIKNLSTGEEEKFKIAVVK